MYRRHRLMLIIGAPTLLLLAACAQPAQPSPTVAPTTAAKPAEAAKPTTAPAAPAVAASPATAASPAAAAKPAASPAAASPVASPASAASPVAAGGAGAQAASSGCPSQPAPATARKLRVGLVTDVGKVDDKSFNQSAWEGVQCAQSNGYTSEIRFIETSDPKDYAKNIDQFGQDKWDVIVTVGFGLGEATTAAAKKYPDIRFVGVDQFQGDTVNNLAGLTFNEDKAGYLAGFLAGSLSKSGTVGQVLGTPVVPPVEAFGVGFVTGAKAAKAGIKVLSACHPGGLAKGFSDPEWGKDTANQEMNQGADVIFAAGGNTGNGGLLAIAEKRGTVLGIGVDTDQYLTLTEARPILVSSAMKLITPGVAGLVRDISGGAFKGGNSVGSVGLAPYHDLENQVPADVKTKMASVTADVLAGRVDTKWGAPTGNCPQG